MRWITAPGRNVAPMLAKLSDGELLSRVVSMRDEAAFEALTERHELMVARVCWRVLRHQQDTEDAVQRTFVVLWQKATSIHKAESLQSWLHGAAHHTAGDIRKARGRHRNRELRFQITQITQISAGPEYTELQILVDGAVNRLPEKYRAPFVLHCLEGKSRKKTAAILGLTEGAVKKRVEKARKRLRQWLALRVIMATT